MSSGEGLAVTVYELNSRVVRVGLRWQVGSRTLGMTTSSQPGKGVQGPDLIELLLKAVGSP